MQREGNWTRVAWLGHKLSTMETVGHIIRVTKRLNEEPGLNDFVTMAVDADGLGAGVFDRLIELGYPTRDPAWEGGSGARRLHQRSLGVVLEHARALRAQRHRHRSQR